MGLFDKVFGKKNEPPKISDEESVKRALVEDLKNHFSLVRKPGGWSYEGLVNDQFKSALSDPALCSLVLQKLRPQLRFDAVCVVLGSPHILIVLNGVTPLGIVTSLNADAAANVIANIMKGGNDGNLHVQEIQGLWRLPLPPLS